MVERNGPALTITGTCEGCCHVDPAKTWIGGKRKLFCAEPSLLGRVPRMIGGPQQATPAWCPLLPAAQLALARSVVAASQPSALDLVPPDEAAIHRRMGSTPIVDADALFGQELRVYSKTADSAAHGAGESEE